MVDVMDIGRSGLLAYRAALGVTGENVANVDTPGYRRRDAVLRETGPATGVEVTDIRRVFDALMAGRTRDAQSAEGAARTYLTHVQALEDRMLPGEGGLPDLLDGFFDALDGLSLAPEDRGLRQALLSAGDALAGGVSDLAQGLERLARDVGTETAQAVDEINTTLTGLADLQAQLARTTETGARNPLLDRRDAMLGDLARLVAVEVTLDDRGRASLRLGAEGAGPVLLAEGRAGRIEMAGDGRLTAVPADADAPRVQVQASGGVLGGLGDAGGAIAQAQRDLDAWAGRMAEQINRVHVQGITPEGQAGGALFTLSGWAATPGALMRGDAAAQITVTDAGAMPQGPLTLVHDGPGGLWQARDAGGAVLATGAQTLGLPGLRIELSGTPLDGDRITLARRDDAARYMAMALDDPGRVAAGGALIVSAAPENTGTAPLALRRVDAATGLPDLGAVLGAEPVEFISPGAVGVVPAGTGTALLSAPPRLAAMEIALPEGAAPQSLSLATASGAVDFDFPQAMEADALAAALNSGALLAGDGQSLRDLGLLAQADGGALMLLAREGALPLAATLTTDQGSAVGVDVADAAGAAALSVFTRDGRQLSGPPLGPAEALAFLTPENGFDPQASYSAAYLDGAAPYGGLTLDRMSAQGDHTALLGQSDGLVAWTGNAPAPEAPARALVFEGAGQLRTFVLPQGASAAWAAQAITDALPVRAGAETRLALDLPASGKLSFRLTGAALSPAAIEADLAAGGPAALQAAINAQSARTGIRAELSPGGTRLHLVQEGGADITLTNLAQSDGAPVTLTRLAPDGAALGAVTLGAGGADAARVSGTLRLSSASAFGISEDGSLFTSAPDGFTSGLIARETSGAGSVVALRPSDPAPGDLTLRRIAVTGGDGRVHRAEADPALGDGAEMARALAADLRAEAPASRITGAAVPALPPDGAQLRVALGAQDYAITMSGGAPVVTGPEPDRLVARFDAQNRLVIETRGGDTDGAALRLPADAGEAARFGVGLADAPQTTVIGQPFDAGNLPAAFTVALGGVAYAMNVSSGAVVLPATFPGTGYIDTVHGRVEIRFDARAGEMRIPAQPGAAGAGFDTLGLSAEVLEGALRLAASDDRALAVASETGPGGTTLRLSGVPDEDLVVALTGPGALRLAGALTEGDGAARARELRVLDAGAGIVGLFDAESGAHLASRSLDPAGVARFGDLEITLGGGLATGDRYTLAPNTGSAGDARTIEGLAGLRQRDGLSGEGGYATAFAGLQQRAGAQVSAAQSRLATAEAEEQSALRAESDLGGVDLDAEAARLMEQQQAYQANAQVLSVARQLFDTLLQAI
jgi:flagellar hook-associated protein 1 FlgK